MRSVQAGCHGVDGARTPYFGSREHSLGALEEETDARAANHREEHADFVLDVRLTLEDPAIRAVAKPTGRDHPLRDAAGLAGIPPPGIQRAEAVRTEERRVGQAWVRTCRSRWEP